MLKQYGKLKMIPTYNGCTGCIYENDAECPADIKGKFPMILDTEVCCKDNTEMIFVLDEE